MNGQTNADTTIIDVVLTRKFYENGDYSAWAVKDFKTSESFTVAGNVQGIPGTPVKLRGSYGKYKGRLSFNVKETIATDKFMTTKDCFNYIASQGAERLDRLLINILIDTYGVLTHDKIIKTPIKTILDDVKENEKCSPAILAQLDEAIQNYRVVVANKSILTLLKDNGLTTGQRNKLIAASKIYNESIHKLVTDNVYRLSYKEFGSVPFSVCEKIKEALGLEDNGPNRAIAAIVSTLERLEFRGGDTAIPAKELISQAEKLINSRNSEKIARDAINLLLKKKQLYKVENQKGEICVQSLLVEVNERNVIKSLGRLRKARIPKYKVDEEKLKGLGEQQKLAVYTFFEHPVMLLTGVPGSGKTTTLRTALETYAEAAGLEKTDFLLLAPTGKAAQRMTEQTNLPAQTIHSAIRVDMATGLPNKDLHDYKVVVIDEASMMELQIGSYILNAIKTGTKVVIVGDPEQLPPVGSGAMFRDLILSQTIPTVKLTKVYRQKEGSLIADNAQNVRAGIDEIITGPEFCLFENETLEESVQFVIKLYKAALKNNKPEDIGCLIPFRKKDKFGVEYINEVLHPVVNPKGDRESVVIRGTEYWDNDYIMVTKNITCKTIDGQEVYVANGDTGYIVNLKKSDRGMYPEYIHALINNEIVEFGTRDEWANITHAYSTTIHKSQGSEYDHIIVMMCKEHDLMLKKNLYYTAITRAKKTVSLVGSEEAMKKAIRTEDTNMRSTNLEQRLIRYLGRVKQPQ